MRGTILSWRRKLLARLLFPSPPHQLLQLAFDRRVADAFVLQHAIRIDGEGVRNRLHGEEPCNRPIKAAVTVLRPSHAVLRDEFFPFLVIVIQTHAQQQKWLALKFLCDLPYVRQSLPARGAPCPQKSISTTFPFRSSSETRCPSVVVMANGGAILAPVPIQVH